MTKTDLEFRILVIVICLIFEICDLEFLSPSEVYLYRSFQSGFLFSKNAVTPSLASSVLQRAAKSSLR